MDRRSFLYSALLSGATWLNPRILPHICTRFQAGATGFFRVLERDNRWWLLTPQGEPFFSIGINHIDPASLRYPENIHIWKEKYEGSTIKWLKESVKTNLNKWGFNTVGMGAGSDSAKLASLQVFYRRRIPGSGHALLPYASLH